ncbi:peptide deformylase [Planctomycetota bacterium]
MATLKSSRKTGTYSMHCHGNNGYDPQGYKQIHHLQGFWARVVQHEIDHLNGILIIDHQKNERPCL